MIPFATHDQIEELEALLVEEFNIPIAELMETAGLRLAEFVRQEFPGAHSVILFCGRGHNGGDGLVAARYLQEFGFSPTIVRLPGEFAELPAKHLGVADSLKIPVYYLEDYREKLIIEKFDVVIDCVIGHRLSGAPNRDAKIAVLEINEAHEHNIPVVACDVPSGMDCDEGPVYEPHVRASHILTLALQKRGIVGRGRVFVADIGVPEEAYEKVGLPAGDYFKDAKIIRC